MNFPPMRALEFITGYVIYNPAYTYRFQLKTTIVLVLLYWDKTDKLGVFLGIVMIGMAVLFLIVVIKMGVDWESLGKGFLPNIPEKRENAAEPTDMVLSLGNDISLGLS